MYRVGVRQSPTIIKCKCLWFEVFGFYADRDSQTVEDMSWDEDSSGVEVLSSSIAQPPNSSTMGSQSLMNELLVPPSMNMEQRSDFSSSVEEIAEENAQDEGDESLESEERIEDRPISLASSPDTDELFAPRKSCKSKQTDQLHENSDAENGFNGQDPLDSQDPLDDIKADCLAAAAATAEDGIVAHLEHKETRCRLNKERKVRNEEEPARTKQRKRNKTRKARETKEPQEADEDADAEDESEPKQKKRPAAALRKKPASAISQTADDGTFSQMDDDVKYWYTRMQANEEQRDPEYVVVKAWTE